MEIRSTVTRSFETEKAGRRKRRPGVALLKVSRATFCRNLSGPCDRGRQDAELTERIQAVREESAETTKTRRERMVPYSAPTGVLLSDYLRHRAMLSRAREPLFLSESGRNLTGPHAVDLVPGGPADRAGSGSATVLLSHLADQRRSARAR